LAGLLFLAPPAVPESAAKPPAKPASPPSLLVAPPGEPGSRLTLAGTVVDAQGRPIASAELHVYQTDTTGRYTPDRPMDEPHARLSGRLKTGADGRFELRTIRPGGYPKALMLGGKERKIPAHVHIDVRAASHPEKRFQVIFADDPLLRDPYWADWAKKPDVGVVDPKQREGGWTGTIVLRLD
jgi:protocatechuate 3,4-dioxygenase beta subunit